MRSQFLLLSCQLVTRSVAWPSWQPNVQAPEQSIAWGSQQSEAWTEAPRSSAPCSDSSYAAAPSSAKAPASSQPVVSRVSSSSVTAAPPVAASSTQTTVSLPSSSQAAVPLPSSTQAATPPAKSSQAPLPPGVAPPISCPNYLNYSIEVHQPISSGRYNMSYMRPDPGCRTFISTEVDTTIDRLKGEIKDPDLSRLFENAFPNTLDTAVKWKGTAANSDEELTFLITGDINAMWLRDSANQMQSYLPLLKANSSTNSLASLYRGVINLQARYITQFSYCNSFQPPPESGLPKAENGGNMDVVNPPYNPSVVFECKYELDSLAAFLEISTDYYTATGDAAFFGKYQWAATVAIVLNTTNAMMTPTYASDGAVIDSPYTWQRTVTSATETLANDGAGRPVAPGTGLVRSAFRPSDDATNYQLFIPANMMYSRYLGTASKIASAINQASLATQMSELSSSIQKAITNHGIVSHPKYGQMYAYEIDGFGSQNLMDDANIPSLLSAPLFGYLDLADTTYQNTRKFILSADNPYFMRGPVINAVGGPHNGPGYAWPMASIVRILTSTDDNEIYAALKELVATTSGLGLIHESIWTFEASKFTRPWFSWANGLFGQMILDLEQRKPDLLARSYQ